MTDTAADIDTVRTTYAPDALAGLGAIVTGAASGMGRATSLAFAAAGADVFLTDFAADGLAETARLIAEQCGRTALTTLADLGTPEEAERVVDEAAAALPRITTLANIAGIPRAGDPDHETIDDWQRVLDVNLTALYVLSRAVVPHMREAGGGSIVNISSIIAIRNYRGRGDQYGYPSSKAGVLGLTQSMAYYHGRDGIRVNAILPGLIRTPMGTRFIEAAEQLNAEGNGVPINRIGEPTDIAATAVFLASDGARYITGAQIPVDGGMGVEIGWDRFLARLA